MQVFVSTVTEPKTASKVEPLYTEFEEKIGTFFSAMRFGTAIEKIHFYFFFVPPSKRPKHITDKILLDEKTLQVTVCLNFTSIKEYGLNDLKTNLAYLALNSFFKFDFGNIDFKWQEFVLEFKHRLNESFMPAGCTTVLQQDIETNNHENVDDKPLTITTTPVMVIDNEEKVRPIYEAFESVLNNPISNRNFGKDIVNIHLFLLFVPSALMPPSMIKRKVSKKDKTIYLPVAVEHAGLNERPANSIKQELVGNFIDSLLAFNFKGLDFNSKEFISELKDIFNKTFLPSGYKIQ